MKKNLLIAISLLVLINVSCISDDWEDTSESAIVIEEPIPGKFLKNVLIEDYTGTWCQFCPRVLHGIDQVEEEGLNAYPVSIHRSSGSFPDPYNFAAEALEQNIGLSGYPTAMLNRTILWDNEISTVEVKNQIKPNADLGIALSSTVTGGNINLDVNVKFVENFTDLRLVVYVLEDGLIHDQTNATSFYGGQNPIPNFEHNHVLRSCLTDLVNGIALSGTNAGQTIVENFSVPVPTNVVNASKISFVALVMDASGTVINVRGAKPNLTQTFQENL